MWEKDGIIKPGFEIFADVVDFITGKKAMQASNEIIEEQIVELTMNMKKKAEATTCVDIATVIKSSIDILSIDDVFINDNVSIYGLFKSNDVLNYKINAMKSNFSYLFGVFCNSSVHCIEPYMSIFNIHSIWTEPINISMENEPRILNILKVQIHSITKKLKSDGGCISFPCIGVGSSD